MDIFINLVPLFKSILNTTLFFANSAFFNIILFRDQIRAGNPEAFIVMNGDVCAEFPLTSMLDFHRSHSNAVATMMATEATRKEVLYNLKNSFYITFY